MKTWQKNHQPSKIFLELFLIELVHQSKQFLWRSVAGLSTFSLVPEVLGVQLRLPRNEKSTSPSHLCGEQNRSKASSDVRIIRKWLPWDKGGPERSLGCHLWVVVLPENRRSFVYDCLEPRSKRGDARRTSSERPPFWVVMEMRSCAHAYMPVFCVWVTLLTISDLRRSCTTDLHAFAARSRLITADKIWWLAAHSGPGQGTPFLKLIYLQQEKVWWGLLG